jgi:hypothetical protein
MFCTLTAQTPPPATSSIRGKVTLGDQPTKGLELVLQRRFSSGMSEVIGRAETDGEGRYQFSNISAGEYFINPDSPHLVSTKDSSFGLLSRGIVVAEGEAVDNINFALQRGGVITGKITDSDDYPLIGQPIMLERVNANGMVMTVSGLTDQSRQTDDRGIYRIFGLPSAQYRVSVGRMMAPTGQSSDQQVPQTFYPGTRDAAQARLIEVKAGTEATGIDIKLLPKSRTYEITGRVVNAQTGVPVPLVRVGSSIVYSDGSARSSSLGSIQTNERGEFRLVGFPPGKYLIFAGFDNDADQYSDLTEIEVKDGNVDGVVVKANPGATLNAFVTIDGSPSLELIAKLTELRISPRSLGRSIGLAPFRMSQRIGANGNIVFKGLPSGKYGFSVDFSQASQGFNIIRIEQAGKVLPDGIDIEAGKSYSDVRLVISTGTGGVRGQVRTDPQKADLSEIPDYAYLQVSLRPVKSIGFNSFGNARVNRQGQFTVDGLVPGEYEISVTVGYADGAERRNIVVRGSRSVVLVKRGEYTEVTVPIEIFK